MPALGRVTQKQFGANANPTEIGKFGSLAAGSPAYTNDPTVIQSLSNFLGGWYSAVVGGNSPAIQDMNALFFLIFYQLCYLFQSGVPEYDVNTTYYTGSRVRVGLTTYTSITDNNAGNAVTNTTYWKSGDGQVQTVTAAYTMTGKEDYVRCDAGGGSFNVTLPALSATGVGKRIIFKNVSSNSMPVQIVATGTDKIDGQANYILNSSTARESITLVCAGTVWDII